MWPLFNQLGQFYTWVILFPRILILHNKWSEQINSSSSTRALTGGKNGSPAKLDFRISTSTRYSPVALSLSD